MGGIEIKEREKKKRTDFKLNESIKRDGSPGNLHVQNAQQDSHFSEKYIKQLPAVSLLKNCSTSLVEFFCRKLILGELNFSVLIFRENTNCLRFTSVVNVFSGIAEINSFTHRVVGLGR